MSSMTLVVPTWEGSAPWVGDCLRSLRDQDTAESYTVLVVFDGDVPQVQEIVYGILPSATTVRQPKCSHAVQQSTCPAMVTQPIIGSGWLGGS